MIKLAVSGSCGRMGSRIIALAKEDANFKLTVALEQKGHPDIGKIIEGVKISDNPEEIKNCDCLIEFTNPEATLEHLDYAIKFKKPMIIGTTGLSDPQIKIIKKASEKIPIVFSPNMSVGVNLMFKLVKDATEKLAGDYNVKISEAHHIHKKDAPSGTAKKLAEIIRNSGIGMKDEEIKSIREGEIVGDHEVVFESEVDKITISHSAKTRDIFAKGALVAAKWIKRKGDGSIFSLFS